MNKDQTSANGREKAEGVEPHRLIPCSHITHKHCDDRFIPLLRSLQRQKIHQSKILPFETPLSGEPKRYVRGMSKR